MSSGQKTRGSNNISPSIMWLFCTGLVDDETSGYALRRLKQLINAVEYAVNHELVLTEEDREAVVYALERIKERITPCDITPHELSMLQRVLEVEVVPNMLTEDEKEAAA